MIGDDHSLGGSYRDTILRGYQLLERNGRKNVAWEKPREKKKGR